MTTLNKQKKMKIDLVPRIGKIKETKITSEDDTKTTIRIPMYDETNEVSIVISGNPDALNGFITGEDIDVSITQKQQKLKK